MLLPASPHSQVFTIGIGGAAGDGAGEAGRSLGAMLTDLGYEVFISLTYPSLIRGGHNFSRVSFSREKVWCDHDKLDVLIALNEETVTIHQNDLLPNAVVFADSFKEEDQKKLGANAVVLPMMASVKELNTVPIARNSVALGAACYLMELDYTVMQKILGQVFKSKKLEVNIQLADIGYEFMKKLNFRHEKRLEAGEHKKELLDGSAAFGKGLIAAGLEYYLAYPMTPSSAILHFLAKEQTPQGLKVIQPESELAVINMALGMAYAGKRVAVGSATGGFMLMQEGFSFAAIAELPLVVAVCQRQSPATGVPTYSSQTDLQLVRSAGHGEFPRVVIAPGDPEETFKIAALALNMAWKYQIAVIVLMDKILCEHPMTSSLNAEGIATERGLVSDKPGPEYGRYEITPDGISPMLFPGAPDTILKITSYEHDQKGITTEEADEVKAMINKRFAKMETLTKELSVQETIKTYGAADAPTAVIFWGSTKFPVMEAAKYFTKPVKLVQILWIEPFDAARLAEELAGVKTTINIECNHNAQMAALIREKTGIVVTKNILKYDSRPFDPIELAEEINKPLATRN
jgi:2-oxoglutarate ferredoxin oxidoreductase subunit alpha